MTTLAHTQPTGANAKRVTISSASKIAVAPPDLTVVCLWALTGLVVTALVAAWVGSEDFAGFLGAAG
jgi:hypothetical protein